MKSARGLVAMAGVVALGLAGMGLAKDPFLGNWKITALPDGGGKQFTDVLVFKGGKMTVTELNRKGWAPADYDEDVRQGGVAQFTCTLKHASEGEMKWTGNINASEIRGTIVWTKKGKEEERYSYTGSKND